jgi:hypothetical protein
MQNLSNVCIWGSPFVMSRTDAQNAVEIIFKMLFLNPLNACVHISQNLFG